MRLSCLCARGTKAYRACPAAPAAKSVYPPISPARGRTSISSRRRRHIEFCLQADRTSRQGAAPAFALFPPSNPTKIVQNRKNPLRASVIFPLSSSHHLTTPKGRLPPAFSFGTFLPKPQPGDNAYIYISMKVLYCRILSIVDKPCEKEYNTRVTQFHIFISPGETIP